MRSEIGYYLAILTGCLYTIGITASEASVASRVPIPRAGAAGATEIALYIYTISARTTRYITFVQDTRFMCSDSPFSLGPALGDRKSRVCINLT